MPWRKLINSHYSVFVKIFICCVNYRCQELLALSGISIYPFCDSFYSNLNYKDKHENNNATNNQTQNATNNEFTTIEDYSCCYELYQQSYEYGSTEYQRQQIHDSNEKLSNKNSLYSLCLYTYKIIFKICHYIRKYVKILVDHKYFQQGILFAILINTLSMGIEYHNQPEELTSIGTLRTF